MPRYQVLSQRASVAKTAPSGCVSDGSSKLPSLPLSTPNTATATSATIATSSRLQTKGRQTLVRRAIACAALMPLDLPIADSFWADHRNTITAILTLIGTFVFAWIVDRAISRRGSKLANVMPGQLSPVASTRLRLVRRLVYAAIIVIGVA